MVNAQRPLADLRADTRGAVMVTGVFMAAFLIGALWFVIGIGDTLVFRDRMQEAADHAAFTSAALQAKGMNFIAAINLVMLALLTLHIVLGIVHDISLAVCVLSVLTGCGGWYTARKAYTGYAKTMKNVLPALHNLEVAAAYGYPWVAFAKSYQVGSKYGKQHRVGDVDVFTFSASLVPDKVSRSERVGLPVVRKQWKEVCMKIGDLVFDSALRALDYDPNEARNLLQRGVDAVASVFGKENDKTKVMKRFAEIVSRGPQLRYCNDLASDKDREKLREKLGEGNEKVAEENEDLAKENEERAKNGEPPKDPSIGIADLDKIPLANIDPGFDPFWGESGPLYVDTAASNGNLLMQVWALNLNPKLKETSEAKVKIASKDYSATSSETAPELGYFAQAEFYFDCDGAWSDPQCNGPGADNHAMYSLRWRARLRHFSLPDFGQLLSDHLFALAKNTDPYRDLKMYLTADNPLYTKLSDEGVPPVAIGDLKARVGDLVNNVEAAAKARLDGATEAIPDADLSGIYH